MMELYYAPGTVALASHIALLDAGAEFEAKRVSFADDQQKGADYTTLNPKARVPSLVTKQGTLTETPAILAFIAQAYPEAALAPTDPFAFAEAQAFNSYLCSTLHVAHAHRMRGHRWVDAAEIEVIAAMQRKVPESATKAYRFVEDHAFRGPFVLGEAYSICDAYLFTVGRWLEGDSVDPAAFPKIIAHRALMLERSAVQAAMQDEGLA